MKVLTWANRYLLNGGIKTTDSMAKARAIRISNMISLSAIINTMVFGLLFKLLNDPNLFQTAVIFTGIYTVSLLTGLMGHQTLGRYFMLISGNLIVFYTACIFRGEANIQLLFYSLTAAAFMHFSWEERHHYWLIALPCCFLILGEYVHWSYFSDYRRTYDLRWIKVFGLIAPLHQIAFCNYYFIRQSVKFESESLENLGKLEIEHRKQLQVQKMSSLGEMAGGVSHEINNPLMVIIGKSYNIRRSLKNRIPDDDPIYISLEKIDSMVHRISKIIRALRNFSRNSEHDPSERIDFEKILDITLDLCRERFSSNGVELKIETEKNLFLLCRPTEISQVLLNLLNNAFDASSESGKAEVKISACRNGSQVAIEVMDNGPGIKPEVVDKIMQPFFTTKEVGKGTGLGLSISKGLIEAHQGTLSYFPRSNRTVFQILLPAH